MLSSPAWALRIALDPGHGGIDTGAVYGGAKEADLVLKISQRLQKILDEDPQFQVTMTRISDKAVPLPQRVKIAEEAKAELFVSLHANAAADTRVKGVEFFFQNHLPPDEESLFLASQENQLANNTKEGTSNKEDDLLSKKSDITAIVEDLHRQSRINYSLRLTLALNKTWGNSAEFAKTSIKQAPFYVITKTSMPAVLIEIGFLSNPKEAKRLLTTEYQKDLAQKIYAALQVYREKISPPPAKITVN